MNKTQKLNKTKPRKLLIASAFALLILLLIDRLFNQIVVNISDSHLGTVFWKIDKNPSYGDYVYFDLEHELFPEKTKSLSKQLVCVAGDSLTITNDEIICNDKTYSIKRMEITSGNGKQIPQFYYDGIVPNGQAIVYGTFDK